jgi:hypothetical protein
LDLPSCHLQDFGGKTLFLLWIWLAWFGLVQAALRGVAL